MSNISAGTISRTIILALALLNQVLSVIGHSAFPIEDETINQVVTLVFTIGASITAWWKNNSFTTPAILADETIKNLKSEAKRQ